MGRRNHPETQSPHKPAFELMQTFCSGMTENRDEMGVEEARYWEGARLMRMDDRSGETVIGSSSHR